MSRIAGRQLGRLDLAGMLAVRRASRGVAHRRHQFPAALDPPAVRGVARAAERERDGPVKPGRARRAGSRFGRPTRTQPRWQRMRFKSLNRWQTIPRIRRSADDAVGLAIARVVHR